MTGFKTGEHHERSLLPVVGDGVIHALAADMTGQPDFLPINYRLMHRENPHLAEGVGLMVKAFSEGPDDTERRRLAILALFVYRALRNQAEVDGMNAHVDSL